MPILPKLYVGLRYSEGFTRAGFSGVLSMGVLSIRRMSNPRTSFRLMSNRRMSLASVSIIIIYIGHATLNLANPSSGYGDLPNLLCHQWAMWTMVKIYGSTS